MKDIIEQLEEGSKEREKNNIDRESLYTSMDSKKEDPFSQAEQIIKEQQKEDSPEEKEIPNSHEEILVTLKENLENPDFDFNDFYEKGQKIFFVRVLERLGFKELLELKINSIYPRTIIATSEKGPANLLGYDRKDMIFETKKEAQEVFNQIKVQAIVYSSDLSPNSISATSEEDEEDSEDYLGNEMDIVTEEE